MQLFPTSKLLQSVQPYYFQYGSWRTKHKMSSNNGATKQIATYKNNIENKKHSQIVIVVSEPNVNGNGSGMVGLIWFGRLLLFWFETWRKAFKSVTLSIPFKVHGIDVIASTTRQQHTHTHTHTRGCGCARTRACSSATPFLSCKHTKLAYTSKCTPYKHINIHARR